MSDVFKSAEWARHAEQREQQRREVERLNKKASELPPDPWGFRTLYITAEQAKEYLKKFNGET